MNNLLLQLKLEQRCNKLDSSDYPNLEPWMKSEAVNKAQIQWVRRQLEGINQEKTGNEASTRRIDDLQQLLTISTTSFTDKGLYWQSDTWPSDYLEWCRIDAKALDDCKSCPPRPLVIFEGNEADVSMYLSDANRTPSYDWATTFSTVMNKTFKIWTNDSFDIVESQITYYRAPVIIVFLGSVDPYTGNISTVDVPCEFPDNITEIIIEDAASILVRDIEDYSKSQLLKQSAEFNT